MTNQEIGDILTYIDWNNEIAKHFFNPEKAGTRVWFSVERELIEKIAQRNDTNFISFIEAVKKGPDFVNRPRQTICSKATATFEEWQPNKDQFEYPPYIAYLVLFVLAVNHGDSEDFSEIDYYGRLNSLVGENISTNHFKPTLDLWDDLENWSQRDKQGAWGEFHNDTIGNKFYVGIPLYQVILSKEDKKNLPEIFWKMGWDSDSNPTEEEIISALKIHKTLLSNRISKRIERGFVDFLAILTNRILEELSIYDQDEEQIEDQDRESDKRGSIEICMDIDKTAEQANFYFRCKRKAGLPEEGFILKNDHSSWEVSPSSSNKVKEFNIDDWKKDFVAQSGSYKFYYKGEKYKIFTSGDTLGINGWISGQNHSLNKPFYLAIHNSLLDKIQKWGSKECDQCQKLDFNGLPKDWHLFEIKGINGDKLIKQDIPTLAIDKKPRIHFEGGIRLSKGNRFFSFAPPKIQITGVLTKVQTINLQKKESNDEKTNHISLAPSLEEQNIFELKENTPLEEQISIEVINKDSNFFILATRGHNSNTQSIQNSENRTKKKLMLVENYLKKFADSSNDYVMDHFGNFKLINTEHQNESNNQKKAYFKGADCYNLTIKDVYLRLPSHILNQAKITYLIGNTLGQIIVWPEEPWPELWTPIWMIQFKNYKKGVAYLIGNKKDQSVNEYLIFSKEKINLWQKIAWHNRKRIQSKAQKQWRDWTERIKNV